MNAGRLLNGKRYGRWVKVRAGGCGKLGVRVCKLSSDFQESVKDFIVEDSLSLN